MTNKNFTQAIKENHIEILKDIINDKQKEIKKQQLVIVILISLIFIISIFHFYNCNNFAKTFTCLLKKR